MATIHVLPVSTTILDYLWDRMDLDNEGDEFRGITLKEFDEALTQSLKGERRLRDAEIKWEINEKSNEMIQNFAKQRNIINKMRY